MKRALAILLTFITLATGALFAPAATADGNFKTELWFTLNSDGSIKELINVSSNDNTINADNCKGTETDIVRFARIGKENRCIFIKYYKKGESAPNWSVSREGNSINFRFFNEFYYSLDRIVNTLNIDQSDLNVRSTIVQLPVDATITSQTLSPTKEVGKYSYYIWYDTTATSADIELTGSFSYSPYDPTGRPTTSTPSPARKPSHTSAPFSTASPKPSRGNTSTPATASPTTDSSAAKPATGTNKSVATSISNSRNFNGLLNEFLIIATIASIAIIAGTFLLARISKNSTSAYTPLSAATLYDDQSSSSTQPQTYQTNSNQPRSFTGNQASTQPGHSGRQTQVSSHPGKDSQTDLNSTHKL